MLIKVTSFTKFDLLTHTSSQQQKYQITANCRLAYNKLANAPAMPGGYTIDACRVQFDPQ